MVVFISFNKYILLMANCGFVLKKQVSSSSETGKQFCNNLGNQEGLCKKGIN